MLESIYSAKPSPLAQFLKAGATIKKPKLPAYPPGAKPAANLASLAGSPAVSAVPKLTLPAPAAAAPADTATSAYSVDPVLAKIRAANAGDLAQAEADALDARRKLLLEFGDPTVASKILGQNDPTVGAINTDPNKSMSTLARIARANNESVRTTENDLNAANLFYSGERGRALGALNTEKQTNVTDAEKALEDALGQVADSLTAAQTKARRAEQDTPAGAGTGTAARAAPPAPAPPPPAGGAAAPAKPGKVPYPTDVSAGGVGGLHTAPEVMGPPPTLPQFDPSVAGLPTFNPSVTTLPPWVSPDVPSPTTPPLPPFDLAGALAALRRRLGGPQG